MPIRGFREGSDGTVGGRVRPRSGWPLRLFGALVATVGFWLQGGLAGVGMGVGLAIGAVRLRGWTLFAVGQIGLVATLPPDPPFAAVFVIEVGLFGLLVGDVRSPGESVVTALEAGPITALLGLVTWGAWRWFDAITAGAAVLVLAVTVTGYGMHRYERLSLGYLEDHRERD